jgi:DNA/RNA-binding domain of Phe-tRNA-synthetase-like protein
MITVHHRVPRDDLALGLVHVEGVRVGPAPAALASELDRCVEASRRRGGTLDPSSEALRQGGRAILRNGRYKPTGRGKPASEYLMRAAAEESFPRINGPVDAGNLVSLGRAVAISLRDLDLAGTDALELRLGAPGERYVFNPTGQMLDLEDLVCGCGLRAGGSTPIVTPIKDSMATKLREQSTRLGGAIYYPLAAGSAAALKQIADELLRWLLLCGERPEGTRAVLLPGQSVSL